MKQTAALLLVILITSCQQLRPDSVAVPNYPDVNQIYTDQIQKLHNKRLIKEISLDFKNETDTFLMDSTDWKNELSFLAEIDPNQPEYVGVFDVSERNEVISLNLKEGENGILKKLVITISGDDDQSISAVTDEGKDIYTHHREFRVQFDSGLIRFYEISGYQKMILKDTVWFGIKGSVID